MGGDGTAAGTCCRIGGGIEGSDIYIDWEQDSRRELL